MILSPACRLRACLLYLSFTFEFRPFLLLIFSGPHSCLPCLRYARESLGRSNHALDLPRLGVYCRTSINVLRLFDQIESLQPVRGCSDMHVHIAGKLKYESCVKLSRSSTSLCVCFASKAVWRSVQFTRAQLSSKLLLSTPLRHAS